ncbi:MAG: hypothetical protein JSV64_06055 [Candidatus Bathyarchaeota archaeon]|nr:MAG: hypothetical protein JSV64_06055 [Candidatus Bathyarchaeota archaeon]
MSREDEPVGFAIAEKFFALLIILIGSLLTYNAATSPRISFPALFIIPGLALIILGLFMVLARSQ